MLKVEFRWEDDNLLCRFGAHNKGKDVAEWTPWEKVHETMNAELTVKA